VKHSSDNRDCSEAGRRQTGETSPVRLARLSLTRGGVGRDLSPAISHSPYLSDLERFRVF